MEVDPNASLKEAVAQFYTRHGLPVDGGVSAKRWSPVGCRDLKVYLPNFEWRRRALPLHDIHHVLTGYPFRPTGEFEMAAWEFAAGRYPNPLSTLFCLPLVSMGGLCRTQAQLLGLRARQAQPHAVPGLRRSGVVREEGGGRPRRGAAFRSRIRDALALPRIPSLGRLLNKRDRAAVTGYPPARSTWAGTSSSCSSVLVWPGDVNVPSNLPPREGIKALKVEQRRLCAAMIKVELHECITAFA